VPARDKGARPLVVKKVVEGGGHGHHGGAWKVAYADFVTAMMAFFLLLWLLSTSSEETLKGLAEYFSESIAQTGPPGGVGGALQGLTVIPDAVPRTPSSLLDLQPTVSVRRSDRTDQREVELGRADAAEGGADGEAESSAEAAAEAARRRRDGERLEAAKAAIETALSSAPDLQRLKDSLVFDQTPEGLRIQIVDREQYAMFPLGSDAMYPHTRRLLAVVAQAVRDLPNRISIRGHTDARPFAPRAGYDNWRLSSDRANATRLALLEVGLAPDRVAEVVGRADAEPLVPTDPHDPRNRRISLVLLNDRTAPGPPG
jgi:chemotaxis protein MotB